MGFWFVSRLLSAPLRLLRAAASQSGATLPQRVAAPQNTAHKASRGLMATCFT